MNLKHFVQQYWPLLALGLWLGYRWWAARRVRLLLPGLRQQGAALVDVRSEAEFAASHAPGTVNIPLHELGQRLHELSPAVPVVVGCASGTRSGMARMLLKRKGYRRVYNIGAWRNFQA